MKSAIIALVSVAIAAGAYAQSLTINTPSNAVVCQPLQISWTGGQGPWFLSVLPGADPTGAALEDFGQQSSSPFTWQAVNFPQGTSLGLTLRDSQGNTAQSAPFTVNPGSDTSCLNASGSSSAPASASAPASTSASASQSSSVSSAPASTTGAGASTSAGLPAASSSASSRAPSPASSSGRASTSASTTPSATAGGNDASGAVVNAASLGVAAVAGGIVLAVLA